MSLKKYEYSSNGPALSDTNLNVDDVGAAAADAAAAAAADGDAIDDDGRVRRGATRGGVSADGRGDAAESSEGGGLQPPILCNLRGVRCEVRCEV